MHRLTRDELRTLAAQDSPACVSLYLPLQRTYPQTNENSQLLRSMLDEAEELVGNAELIEPSAVEAMLAPARELVRQEDYWQAADAAGLAVFLAASNAQASTFQTWRLSYSVEQSIDVGTQFRLAPLVPLIEASLEFQLLALGQKHVRLYSCTRDSMASARLPAGVPGSFDAYVAGTEIGRPIQFRASAAAGIGGDQVGLVHGQTSYKDDHKMRTKEFVSHVARAFRGQLKHGSVPLVVAAADFLHPVFREACPEKLLVAEGVIGSPDELSEQEMHAQAVRLIDAWQERRIADFNGTYATRLAHGHASHQIDVILPAAEQGRVDSLVIARGVRVWGARDRINETMTVHDARQPGDVDLLELVLRETLLHGGDVHSVDAENLIDSRPAAAILRW